MERVRLTQRVAARNRKADSAEPETAIDLGKNRTYHKIDEYHTFEPSLNHWEPDMRHEWKDNPREETGHGIPKMAKVYLAAKKATKLAMMFLGEKADEESIEKQARAFMRMGDKALTASINRWADCNGDDCETAAEQAAPAAPVVEEAPAAAPAQAAEQDAPVAPVVEEAPAAAPAQAAEQAAPVAPVVEEAPAAAPAQAAEQEVPAAPAVEEEAEQDEDVEVDEAVDTDIQFDDAPDGNEDADSELEACFQGSDQGEEVVAPAVEDKTVARKAGIKKLAGGQPTLTRVASKKADDLAGLWDKWSNPDVR